MTERQAGFTLVEIVVALTVGALVTLVAHTTVSQTLDTATRSRNRLAAAQHSAGVRKQLADWLGGAQVSSSNDSDIAFLGGDAAEDTTRCDQLRFVSATALAGEWTEIHLFIDDDPHTRERGLVASLGGDLTPTHVVGLEPSATDLEIRYLFRINTELRWFSGWSSSIELPLAVEIRLLGENLPPLLQLPITVAVGGRG